MNWKLVGLLACAGLVIGIATVLGINAATEGWLWVGAAFISAVAIAVIERDRPFRHGFAAGFFGGLITPLMQALLFHQYVANNPAVVNQVQGLPLGLGPQAFFLVLAPIAGLVNGLTLAILAWASAKLRPRRKTQPAAA